MTDSTHDRPDPSATHPRPRVSRRARALLRPLVAALLTIAAAPLASAQQPAPDGAAQTDDDQASQHTQTQSAEPRVIAIDSVLALPRVTAGGRGLVQLDAFLAAWLDDPDLDPLAIASEHAAALAIPDALGGGERSFVHLTARPDGVLAFNGWAGGYAVATLDIEPRHAGVYLLQSRGNRTVWVNGQPRYGDLYNAGFLTLPVELRPGANTLVFRMLRNELLATLTEAPRDAGLLLLERDRTIPDFPLAASNAGAQPGGFMWAAIPVANLTDRPLRVSLRSPAGWQDTSEPAAPRRSNQPFLSRLVLPPLSVVKAPVAIAPLRLDQPGEAVRPVEARYFAIDAADANAPPANHGVAFTTLTLRAVAPGDVRRVTHRSAIDNSVQYYAVREAVGPRDDPALPGITLSLHGASVPADRQARAYRQRNWTHLVAPTNRRPFGFDWEDWGRIDALEAFHHAKAWLEHDPARQWLTGHSMGGHGTLHIAAHHPDLFAAAAPSAGWADFWSYTGGPAYSDTPPDTLGDQPTQSIAQALDAATLASRTLRFADNWRRLAFYVLHGDRDETVPVREARSIRQTLAEFHADFTYYEREGAGHWWGDQCMDWPGIFHLFQRRERDASPDLIRFVSAGPAVNTTHHWARIDQVDHHSRRSLLDLRRDRSQRRITGTIANVARLTLDLADMGPGPVSIVINARGDQIAWEGETVVADDATTLTVPTSDRGAADAAAPRVKQPHRSGSFKRAFDNDAVLVVPTAGAPDVNAAWDARARFDNERWWYRANGSFDVMTDRAALAALTAGELDGRNVILYGDADSNAAWNTLLPHAPFHIAPASNDAPDAAPLYRLTLGELDWIADDLALLALFTGPRADRPDHPGPPLVGVVAGSGPRGAALSTAVPYMTSGVGLPELLLFDSSMLRQGVPGVLAAGWFDNAWSLDRAEMFTREQSQ